MPVKTFKEAQSNLSNNLYSLGDSIPPGVFPYEFMDNDLEKIITDLIDAKNKYAMLSLMNITNEDLDSIKREKILPLRSIILDALKTLTPSALSKTSIDTGRSQRISLLCILAELGEMSLFYQAFKKTRALMNNDDLAVLLVMIHYSYEGSRIAEPLNLGKSLLHRGDQCYILMAEQVLKEIAQRNNCELLNQLEEMRPSVTDGSLLISLEELQECTWNYLESYRPFGNDFLYYWDQNKVVQKTEEQYENYVAKVQGIHLFWERIDEFRKNPDMFKGQTSLESLSSSFTLGLFANKKLMIAAGIFVVLGLIGLGVIGLACTAVAATALATAGAASVSLGLGLGIYGLFAGGTPKRSTKEQEYDFFVGINPSPAV